MGINWIGIVFGLAAVIFEAVRFAVIGV
jgi:hypothetical protein